MAQGAAQLTCPRVGTVGGRHEVQGSATSELARQLDVSCRTMRRLLCQTGLAKQEDAGSGGEARTYDSASIEAFVNSRRWHGHAVYRAGDDLVSPPTLSRLWEVAPQTVRRLLDGEGLTSFALSKTGPDSLGRSKFTVRYLNGEVEVFLSAHRAQCESPGDCSLVRRQLVSPRTLCTLTKKPRGVVARTLRRLGVGRYCFGNSRSGAVRYPAKEAVTALLNGEPTARHLHPLSQARVSGSPQPGDDRGLGAADQRGRGSE